MSKTQVNKYAILGILKENPNKYFSAKRLAILCNLDPSGTQVSVRKAITELVELDLQPIMAACQGYCYTDDVYRMATYHEDLVVRMVGLDKRRAAVSDIIQRMRGY